MKKVSIVNIKNNQTFQNISENPTEWINDCVVNNYWGLPERWIIANSEPYEESDILETEERKIPYLSYEINDQGHTVEVQKERTEIWILLKADYTIEIIDLEKDYDWLLSECHRKRKAEYPPYEDYLDAVVKGDEQQKQEYIDKCLEIKNKYPKPIKESL